MKLNQFPTWAMLATNYYDLDLTPQTFIIQPKLDGVRARWHHIEKVVISREGHIIPRKVIPHIYEQFERLVFHRSLDGELYHHGWSFQKIAGIVGQGRIEAALDSHKLQYYVFDLLSDETAIKRQDWLKRLIPIMNCVRTDITWCAEREIKDYLSEYRRQGYEGVMLRNPNAPYQIGRTRDLIKVKKLIQESVVITDIIEGKGKFINALGALVVRIPLTVIEFKIGGGAITTKDRQHIWKNRKQLLGRIITISYTEVSDDNIPLKAQIVNSKEFYV